MVLITESKLRVQKLDGISNPYVINEGDKITPAAIDYLRENKVEINYLNNNSAAAGFEKDSYPLVPAGISNRHIHLSYQHIEALFGKGHVLTKALDLSQPGQFAAEERLTLLGPKGFIQNVRVLGPERTETQVEISKTDGFKLGIHPPVRLSGSIEGTPGITIIGPKASIVLEKGTIVAKAHVHMSSKDAKKFKVGKKDTLMLQTTGERSLIFPQVDVRINDRFVLDCHLDLDEGNAADLKNGDKLKVIGKNGQLFAQVVK